MRKALQLKQEGSSTLDIARALATSHIPTKIPAAPPMSADFVTQLSAAGAAGAQSPSSQSSPGDDSDDEDPTVGIGGGNEDGQVRSIARCLAYRCVLCSPLAL